MYYHYNDTTAYKLETPIEKRMTKAKHKSKANQKARERRAGRINMVICVIAVFAVMFSIIFRYVQIYGLHTTIAQKTAQLENVQMANEQLKLDIESKTDSAKVEEYATNELGLRKMNSNQVVYLQQTPGDTMEKVAINNDNRVLNKILGIFSFKKNK